MGGGGGGMVKIREKNSSFVNALIVIIIFTSNLIPGLISNVKYKTNHHPPKKRGGIHMISREVGGWRWDDGWGIGGRGGM